MAKLNPEGGRKGSADGEIGESSEKGDRSGRWEGAVSSSRVD